MSKEKDLSAVPLEDLLLIQQGKFEKLSEAGADAYNHAPDLPDSPKEDNSVLGKLEKAKNALKSRGWENLSPTERLSLMALAAPGKMAEETIGFTKGTPAMAMRAVPVAIGQKLGQLSRIPGAPQALGAVGGALGEVAADLYEKKSITAGGVLSAAGAGAVRGRHTSGLAEFEKEAMRQGAINTALDEGQNVIDKGELKAPSAGAFAGGVVAAGVQKLLDSGARAEKMAVKKADEYIAYEKIGESAKHGYPIFPKEAVPTPFEKATNALIRSDLGLPATTKLTTGALKSHIVKLTEPHRLAAKLSTESNTAFTGMQEALAAHRLKYKQYRASMGNRPDLLEEADQFKAIADSFENDLINESRKLGKFGLVEAIIENKPLLAKTYLAQKAINPANAVGDAAVYGAEMKKNPGRLTGDAKIIAETFLNKQQVDFRMKNLLSRPVTIYQTLESWAEHTKPVQVLSRNKPDWHQYPDLSADASRLLINKASRDDTSKANNTPASKRVKKWLFTVPNVPQ